MKLKIIPAILLLMTYLVSFGHGLIPHHNHHSDASTAHHHHLEEEVYDHDHVAHEDHFDEGMFDYLACILGDHEHHPITECEFVQGVNDQTKTENKKLSVKKENKIFFSFENVLAFKSEKKHHFNFLHLEKNLFVNSLAKRGPPMV